jgi:hypothetical protein
MADLEHILLQLHDSEINAGVQTFYDAGMRVWIGDEANGIQAETTINLHVTPKARITLRVAFAKADPCGAGLFGKPGLAFQLCLVDEIDEGRGMLDDLARCPLAQDPAGVLARHIGQGSQVVAANLVADEQLARCGGRLSQVFGKLK